MGKITVPAGSYYLGDPCYSFKHETWSKILDNSNFLEDVYQTGEGLVVAFNTAYGDGCYFDQFSNEYPVDAGMIGLVSQALADRGLDGRLLVTFYRQTECYTEGREGGILHFGEYRINTEGSEEDDE